MVTFAVSNDERFLQLNMKRILSIAIAALLLLGLSQSCKTIEECPTMGQVEAPAENV